MPKRSLTDQLDQAVEALLSRSGAEAPRVDSKLAALVDIAQDLRDLPNQSFKARLKSNLERTSFMASQATSVSATRQTATAHLRIKNVAAAIEFYKKAFGAKEIMRFEVHSQIPYAEIAIGNSVISLGEEALEHGYPGPQTLGGSPVGIHLSVEDVDAFVAHAVAAGAKLAGAVTDQFYGDRSGSVSDPFGYTWGIATRKVEMSVDEMHQRFNEMMNAQEANRTASSFIPEGYHTITPYLVAQDAPALIDFVKQVFGAEETFRAIGPAGGIHAEIRIGDSMLMMGGGAPDLSWSGQTWPTALHIYVKDTDAAYERALKAGAQSIQPPADQEYGERSGSVKDQAGNHWYIATSKAENYIPEGLRTVNPYLHPLRGEPVINFLKRGFGAEELAKYASPDGVIHHARIKIGDSVLEMGEAQGPYQPMPTMFYLYVPDVDAMYSRALNAGGISTGEPADQPYGDRTASVKDAFGNQWYIATHIRDMQS